jgi:aryl-alcohol dehydrogenase-like predicted oxidoreductase
METLLLGQSGLKTSRIGLGTWAEGWHIDARNRTEIDAILARCIQEPLPPSFMAPPARKPLNLAH